MTLRKWWKAWSSQNVIGGALLFLALVSGITTYVQTVRTNSLATCTAAYQTGFSQALMVRTQTQAGFNRTLNNLLFTVANQPPRQEVVDALQAYVKAAQERDKALAENPYPDPVVCQ